MEANKPLPNLPAGQVEGGSSEFVDGKIYQCCGSNVNIYDTCYSLDLGDENWAAVRFHLRFGLIEIIDTSSS